MAQVFLFTSLLYDRLLCALSFGGCALEQSMLSMPMDVAPFIMSDNGGARCTAAYLFIWSRLRQLRCEPVLHYTGAGIRLHRIRFCH